MAYQIPTTTPSQVRIGTSWFWDIAYPDFPASDGWEFNLYFRGPTDLDVAWGTGIAADGDGFSVRITPAIAADLTTAGKYLLVGTVTLSGEVHEVERRHILALVDPASALGAKSFNRQRLEALQAATAPTAGVMEITVNGRTIRYGQDEYDKALARYTLLVAIEENPTGRLIHEAVFTRG